MAIRQDVQKRRVWAERLSRYRVSGLTAARFCASERVSVNTFYYWASRVGAVATAAPLSPGGNAAELRGEPKGQAYTAVEPAVVRFHFNAAVEVSVPADCLDAIRCLAQCVQPWRAEGRGAFQEVIVARQ